VWAEHLEPPQDGHRVPPSRVIYVGWVSAEGVKQHHERQAEGEVLFWSVDGSAIYYAGRDELLYRLDVASKHSKPVTTSRDVYVHLLGKVPGADAIFVRQNKDSSPSVVSLDGTAAAPELVKLAASIANEDAAGRKLVKIETRLPHRLLLRYASANVTEPQSVEQINLP